MSYEYEIEKVQFESSGEHDWNWHQETAKRLAKRSRDGWRLHSSHTISWMRMVAYSREAAGSDGGMKPHLVMIWEREVKADNAQSNKQDVKE